MLHRVTSTIPIVFVGVGNAVAQGLATSLSEPGGNMSGISQMVADLGGRLFVDAGEFQQGGNDFRADRPSGRLHALSELRGSLGGSVFSVGICAQ
jgi:hypothetical protein